MHKIEIDSWEYKRWLLGPACIWDGLVRTFTLGRYTSNWPSNLILAILMEQIKGQDNANSGNHQS